MPEKVYRKMVAAVKAKKNYVKFVKENTGLRLYNSMKKQLQQAYKERSKEY